MTVASWLLFHKNNEQILMINFSRKGIFKRRSNYILGKIDFIFWIPINLQNLGDSTLVDVRAQWFLVHPVSILSINIYNYVT